MLNEKKFINEFSKIGGLEIKEMGVEKKKVGTFRQQLEKFLKEMEVKPSFPTGIDFKVSFLDYLKEDKEFYAVLGKGWEIIFADVSPWRRKDKLTELAKKYSLEPFSACLAKLKEVKEKSPAAVSFRYMIEAIKAFLEGEKYGEFQAKKEKLEERNKIERKNQDQAKEKKEIVEKLKGKKNIPVNETNIKKYQNELEDFVSRNLNDTRMIATYLLRYIQNELNKKEEFRTKIATKEMKEQLRSLTPYHHAIDAIVLAHFKSRAYIQSLEDLTKISQGKLKLKRGKITSEQLNSLFQEISATKEVDISLFFPLPDLHDIIERRIPVQLEKKSEKEVKEIIIAVEKVLTEEEYAERVKGMQGNIHYPYISYAVDRKVKKETVASEQADRSKRGIVMFVDICEKLQSKEKLDLPKKIGLSNLVKKIGLGKLNSEYGEKYNFVIVKKGEDNYTIWDTSKYDAGFGVKKDGKAERIKNIELLRKKKMDGELAKLIGLPLIYTGTTGDNVSSINIVGLIYDKKENPQTIYPEHGDRIIKISNAINNSNELGSGKKSVNKIGSSLKPLKINILGKKEK
ncbi:12714_t:CDS:10 [Cetraspora pellucida]|uniref:12714_t:CDS:1 n=1 Tax=Cetraspora pellucida TaxID=1433469 RepID=A0ACA9MZK5_9GLOM|nr:12714_t:CDS:10 [Cetraspora pellucida]